MGSGTRLCRGKVLSTLEHPCRSTVAKLAIFMIMGHKDKRYGFTYEKTKVMAAPFSGLHTYLGLRIRPNVALTCLFIFFEILGHV